MPALIGWKPTLPDPNVASTRIRCLNPLGELIRRSFPIELFKSEHLEHYRVALFSKVHDTSTLSEAREAQQNGTRVLVDMCDNRFLILNPTPAYVESISKLRELLAMADGWVASTEEMAATMQREAGPRAHIDVVGDALEERIVIRSNHLSRWRARWEAARLTRVLPPRANATRLVWFGAWGGLHSPGGMRDLKAVRPLLERLQRSHPFSLTVISNNRAVFDEVMAGWEVPTYYLEWRASTVMDVLRLHDVALVPVDRNPFTVCKTNNRLVTAFEAGLPVVADAIPSYQEFANSAFLDRWEEGLTAYATRPDLRMEHARRGKAQAHASYSLKVIADRWQQVLSRELALVGEATAHS